MSKPKLSDDDFCRAAKTLRCDVSTIKAVAEVESRGEGFYPGGFPVILFERHKFRSFTHGQYNETYPQISGPAGGYGSAGQNQRNKFNLAFKLDPEAAMKSCSWGKFQIMGFNFALCGFTSVGAFVDAMKESEGRQLDAFVQFVIHSGLAHELRDKDFAGFAQGYNGADYKKNRYDTKMATADRKFAKENIDCSQVQDQPQDSTAGSGNNTQDQGGTDPAQSTSGPVPAVTDPSSNINPPAPLPDPVTVPREQPSIWAKIMAGATFLTGLGINAGTLVQQKLSEMTPIQIGYLVAALSLCGIAVWLYQKAAKGAQVRTLTLVEKAADPTKNTVELK